MAEPKKPIQLWDPELDEVVEDARTSVGRTPEERWAMFASIQRMVAAAWRDLSEEEMLRRMDIGDALDPRPDPWWKNVRREGLP
ncbi:MAG: hypothetical protein ACUVYA_18605 [Planctomycetota bacterium]